MSKFSKLRTAAHTDLNQDLSSYLPEGYNLQDVASAFVSNTETTTAQDLACVVACLESRDRLQLGDGISGVKQHTDEAAAVNQIISVVESLIRPTARENERSDQDVQSTWSAVTGRVRETAPFGLRILELLADNYDWKFDLETLATLASLTDPDAPWGVVPTRTTSIDPSQTELPLAEKILLQQLQLSSKSPTSDPLQDYLTETLLKRHLRAQFSRKQNLSINASGRPAAFPDEPDTHRGLEDDSPEIKPWKYVDLGTISLVAFAIQHITEDTIKTNWPLFTPVLLTLVDESYTPLRIRGLALLQAFLAKMSASILYDTGLASVFEDAVFPTLHFLPSLTPPDESALLLPAASGVLLQLADAFGAGEEESLSKKEKAKSRIGGKKKKQGFEEDEDVFKVPQRKRLLDKMLREGVFSAYDHVKEYPGVVEVIMDMAAGIVEAMGLQTVKHLKDLLPMYAGVMTDPLITVTPKLLDATLAALQTTMTTCWPRVSTPVHRETILNALVICHLTIHDDNNTLPPEQLQEWQKSLQSSAKTITVLVDHNLPEDAAQVRTQIATLIAAEPILANLFASTEDEKTPTKTQTQTQIQNQPEPEAPAKAP